MNLIILLIILGVSGVIDFPEDIEPHANSVQVVEKIKSLPRKKLAIS